MNQIHTKYRVSSFQQNYEQQYCHECNLRQKYVTGSNKKCFKHQFQQKQKQISNFQISVYDQIISSINDIYSLIPEFQQQLKLIHKEDAQFQVQDILNGINQIKQKLGGKELLQNSNETSIINYSKSNHSLQSKLRQSRQDSSRLKQDQHQKQDNQIFTSDKTQTLHFQIQQDAINQYIKQWVIFFSDKLTISSLNNKKKAQSKKNNSIIKQKIVLPFQQTIQMGMFKQTIISKYQQHIKKLEQKDNLLNQAINKLAFYVDKFDKISPKIKKQFNLNQYTNQSNSSLFNKYLNPITPIRSTNKLISNHKIGSKQSIQSGSRTSRSKQRSKQSNEMNGNTTSFVIDNVSGIFQNTCMTQDTYFLLMVQAEVIQQVLSKRQLASQFPKSEQMLIQHFNS